MSEMLFKVKLANYLREQADWRDEKAVEHPEDERNSRCAHALRGFARYIEELPEDNENLRVLASVQPDGLDVYSPGDEARILISRLGFNAASSAASYDGFLAAIAELDVDRSIEDWDGRP